MDVTSASPDGYAAQIKESYPFHFSIRDLYARFRENPGFQQTRGLIRLMRTVVAAMYREGGRADDSLLVHPYDVDLNDKETAAEITSINPTLANAIAHDVADGGNSVAEQIDRDLSGRDAQDAATLLLMASLASVPDAVKGLTKSEVVSMLCAPGRDVSALQQHVLAPLYTSAWYLHVSSDGRLFFKNVENLVAKLKSVAGSFNRESQLRELREFLASAFEPSLKDCYQSVSALPAIDQIAVGSDKVTLVVAEPKEGGGIGPEMQAFYDQLDYKNRVLFLTGQKDTLDRLLETAAELKAIRRILAEMDAEKTPENDPQRQAAVETRDNRTLRLLSAARETFTTLAFPFGDQLRTADFLMHFNGNQYSGEKQVREALESKKKFETDVEGDAFRKKLESRLFTQREMPWAEVKKRAAVETSWPWHRADALDRLHDRMLLEGQWVKEGDYVNKQPPEPTTGLRVQEISRDDDTGEATLRLTLVYGDTVYAEVGGTATSASEQVQDVQAFKTSAMAVSFLCVELGRHARDGRDGRVAKPAHAEVPRVAGRRPEARRVEGCAFGSDPVHDRRLESGQRGRRLRRAVRRLPRYPRRARAGAEGRCNVGDASYRPDVGRRQGVRDRPRPAGRVEAPPVRADHQRRLRVLEASQDLRRNGVGRPSDRDGDRRRQPVDRTQPRPHAVGER